VHQGTPITTPILHFKISNQSPLINPEETIIADLQLPWLSHSRKLGFKSQKLLPLFKAEI
jgi:hypothetical protein